MHRDFLKENFFICSLLTLILVVTFFDVAFMGKTFKLTTGNPQSIQLGVYGQEKNKPLYFAVQSTDAVIVEEPVHQFIKDSFRKGIYPLWNPHQACGYPLVGMMQVGILWPLNYLVYLLPSQYGWDLLIFFRFFLAGLFTYWFMRTLRYDKTPSVGAAVIYMLSGPMVLMQYRFANVELLTPLIMLCFERLIRRSDIRRACLAGVAVALTFFAGDPEHIFIDNAVCFIFFFFRLFTVRPRANRLKAVYFLAASYVMAVGLAAVVFFPFLRNWATEFWHTHPENMGTYANGAPIIKETMVGFFIPHFFQEVPLTLNYVRSSWIGYLGLLPLVFVLFSLLQKQRQRLNYFFAGSALFFFLKSYVSSPLINWIGYIPGFNLVRFAFHTPHVFAFLVSISAGMGIRVLLNRKPQFLKALLFSFFFAVCAGIALFYYRKSGHFPLSVRSSLLALGILTLFLSMVWLKDKKYLSKKVFSILLIFFICCELFLYVPHQGARMNRFDSYPPVPYIEYLKGLPQRTRVYGVFYALYPNTASGYQIDDMGVIHGLLTKRFVNFVNRFVMDGYFKKDFWRTAFWIMPFGFIPEVRTYYDLLNVEYTIAPKNLSRFLVQARDPGFPKPIYSKEVDIYKSPSVLPRVFIVHKVVFEPEEELVFDRMEEIKRLFRYMAVINHEPIIEIAKVLKPLSFYDQSNAKIVEYTPNEVIIRASLENPGFLVLGDLYHPDWKAFVNGQETKIYITNYLIRSVFLQKGEHEVRFVFRPFSFYLGLWTSLSFLILLVVLLLRTRKNVPRKTA